MDSVGEGEGGEIWENGIETCMVLRAPVKGLEPGRSLLWGGGALLG